MITESGQQIAVVANQIIQARHRLDPRQQKVIAWAIGQTMRDDSDFLTHTLSISEFAHLTGSESGSLFREMEAVTTSLLTTILQIKENEGDRSRTKFQWLSHCKYHDTKGTVEIRLHDLLKPYLLELRTRFTQIRLDHFFKFRSSYTIRFFERCEMMRGQNKMNFQLPLLELRDWLGIAPEAYEKFGLFRAYVLDAAQNELDEKSDWSFSFVTIKTGRKITGVEFTLRPARSPKINPIRERWKKAKPDLQAAIMSAARELPRFEDLTDSEIHKDSAFWERLPALFDRVDKGQTALGL